MNQTTEPDEECRARIVDIAGNLKGLDSHVVDLVRWDTVASIPVCSSVSLRGAVTQREVPGEADAVCYELLFLFHMPSTSETVQ